MIQSRLVTRKTEIEHELRLMNYGAGRLDPRRKQYLVASPLQIERDITAMGFSEEEVKKNNFAYGGDKKQVVKGVYSLISRARMPAVRGISPFPSEIGSRDRVEYCVAVRLIE